MNRGKFKCFVLILVTIFYVSQNLLAQTNDTEKTRFEFKSTGTKNKINLPEVDEILRVKPGERVSPAGMRNTCFVMQPTRHEVDGDSYVILTDHTDKKYLDPLEKLAKFRKGTILKTSNLALLYSGNNEAERIKTELKRLKVKYLALAPRPDSYTENMLLGFYEIICNLDDDPQLDVYPGVLLASGAREFRALINRSVKYATLQQSELSPMACCMVPNNKEFRSLQKNGILHNMFLQYGFDIPMLNVYGQNANEAPDLVDSQVYRLEFQRKHFIQELPAGVEETFKKSSMLIFHGHGLPGASCGLSIEAIPDKLETDIVLMGSCFSASSQNSDITPVKISPDGYQVIPKKSMAIEFIDKGASVVLGHMRLNSGFPRLYPVLESFMAGRTVGESYQELVNVSLAVGKFDTKNLALRSKPESSRLRQNGLLYILFGDPALQPINSLVKLN